MVDIKIKEMINLIKAEYSHNPSLNVNITEDTDSIIVTIDSIVMVKITAGKMHPVIVDGLFPQFYSNNINLFNNIIQSLIDKNTPQVGAIAAAREEVKKNRAEYQEEQRKIEEEQVAKQEQAKIVEATWQEDLVNYKESEELARQAVEETVLDLEHEDENVNPYVSFQGKNISADQLKTPTQFNLNDELLVSMHNCMVGIVNDAIDESNIKDIASVNSKLKTLLNNQEKMFKVLKSLTEEHYMDKLATIISDKFLLKTKAKGGGRTLKTEQVTQWKVDTILKAIRDNSIIIKLDKNSWPLTWDHVHISQFNGDGTQPGDIMLSNGEQLTLDALFEDVISGKVTRVTNQSPMYINAVVDRIINKPHLIKGINVRTGDALDFDTLDLKGDLLDEFKEDVKTNKYIFKITPESKKPTSKSKIQKAKKQKQDKK